MAKLYFKVGSDVDKVIQLRQEIVKLKQELMSMDVNKAPAAAKTLQVQLGAATQEFNKLTTEAAKAGAVMGNDFKSKIYQGSQAVNDLTQKITNQKIVIRDIEADVRKLSDAYRTVRNNPLQANNALGKLNEAKKALQEEKSSLFGLQTEQSNTRLSVKRLRDEYALYKDDAKEVVNANGGMSLSLGKVLGVIGGVAAVKQLGSEIIRVRGEFQQLDVAFTTLLQSKEKANALMSQMVETAAKTPFNLTELATGARQLVAYGFQAEEINGTLVRLGNIASGLGLPLERLTYLYGTTMTQGRLYTRDMMQFTTSGIPMLQGLADMYGVSTAKINEMVTAGKIGFPEVQKVIENMTNEGGKFFNLMEEQSKTITGKISNLGDAMDGMFNSIGQANEGIINDSIDGLKYLVENYEQVGRILLGLVATYGTYKAATIAYYAITKTYGVYDIATKKLQFAATMKNVVATNAMIIKQKLLNATMLKNPYVLVATLVIGAAAAMWALHDGTTAAEKAQRKYNDEQEKFANKENKRKQKIEELIRVIQDETETQYAKIKAYEELQRYSPALVSSYSMEQLATLELAKSQKVLNEERDNVNYDNIIANIKKYTEYVNRLSKPGDKMKNVGDMYSGIVSEYGVNTTFKERFEQAAEDLKKWKNHLNEYDRLKKQAEEDAKPVEVKLLEAQDNREQILQEFLSAKMTLEEEQRKIKESGFGVIPIDVQIRFDNAKAQLSNIDKIIAALMHGNTTQTYKEAYNTAQREWKAAQKALEESKKKSKAEYIAAKKDLDEKEKNFKDLGGATNSTKQQESSAEKLRKQNEKLKELASKQSIERVRAEEDLQNQVDQSRINSMKEGSEKILAQMELDHEKELQAIDRQMEDLLLKKKSDAKSSFEANPENKGKSFDDSNVILSDSELKQFDSLYMALLSKQATDTDVFYKSVTDKYQDYTTQRLAIEKQFNEDIAILQEERKRAQEGGDIGKVEMVDRAIAQATTDKGKALIGFDYEQLKQSPEYVRAFENLKYTSSETLNSLLSQLENAKGAAAKVLSPDQLREYTTTIQDIMNELDERNPWQALSDKKQELADAEQELAQAQIELESARQTADAVKGGAKIESGISSSKYNPKTGKIDSTKAYLTEAQALDKVKAKTDNYNKSKDKVVEKSAKVKKSEKDVTDQIDELSKAISDVGNSIGGPAGEIISLIGDIGSFTMMAISGVKMAADTSAQAISTVEKASVILMIISAAIQLATKVMSFFAADYSDYNESKENYEKYVEVLDVIISKQKELIETLTGEAAVRASKDALDLIEKQAQAARNLGKERLNAGASAGSHSIGVRIKDSMSESGWNEALNAIGTGDYNKIKDGRMTGLFDLSVQQLNKLQMEAPEFWAKLDEDVREYLEQIIACNENAEELKGILNESLTGVSFDSVSENFLDALSDMDTSAADFADNFSSYMQKAILNTMMAKTYERRLNDWYESFANANKDGDIDSLDYDKLQTDWEGIVSDALLDRDKLKDLFGWTSAESSSQDSTKGGFETMSQDTGEELNGRFTALQIAGEEIKNQSILQSQSLNLLTFKTDAILTVNTEVRNIADETRTLIANSYLELQEIRENTGAIVKPIIQMQKDMAEVKKNTSKL